MTLTRRDFAKQLGLVFSFTLAGSKVLLTPAQAYAKNVPFKVLRPEEISTLEAVAEILLPGAKQAGVAHFVDYQLNIDPNDSLLILKYFNYPPPYVDFYQTALRKLNELSNNLYGTRIEKLNRASGYKLIETIRDRIPENRDDPPTPLIYHVLRNDAVDVVYGTVEGFKKLDLPYMEHILPPKGWTNG